MVPYLSDDAVRATLAVVAAVPDGEVVLDYMKAVEDAPAAARSDRATLEAHVAQAGEPLVPGRDQEHVHALLREAGFDEIEAPDAIAERQPYEQWRRAGASISLPYQQGYSRATSIFEQRRLARRGECNA